MHITGGAFIMFEDHDAKHCVYTDVAITLRDDAIRKLTHFFNVHEIYTADYNEISGDWRLFRWYDSCFDNEKDDSILSAVMKLDKDQYHIMAIDYRDDVYEWGGESTEDPFLFNTRPSIRIDYREPENVF